MKVEWNQFSKQTIQKGFQVFIPPPNTSTTNKTNIPHILTSASISTDFECHP